MLLGLKLKHQLSNHNESLFFTRQRKRSPEDQDKASRQLAENDGKIKQAADHLGISGKNLWEKMKRYGIEK